MYFHDWYAVKTKIKFKCQTEDFAGSAASGLLQRKAEWVFEKKELKFTDLSVFFWFDFRGLFLNVGNLDSYCKCLCLCTSGSDFKFLGRKSVLTTFARMKHLA